MAPQTDPPTKGSDAGGLAAPRVNPVGVLETPTGYVASPRRHGPAVRGLAFALVLAFTTVVAVTTAATLGRWCLTSEASAAAPRPWR